MISSISARCYICANRSVRSMITTTILTDSSLISQPLVAPLQITASALSDQRNDCRHLKPLLHDQDPIWMSALPLFRARGDRKWYIAYGDWSSRGTHAVSRFGLRGS